MKPSRVKTLFGIVNYGLQVNMWPDFDKSPLKGLADYDFKFIDVSSHAEDEAVVEYEDDGPLSAMRSIDSPPVRAP